MEEYVDIDFEIIIFEIDDITAITDPDETDVIGDSGKIVLPEI